MLLLQTLCGFGFLLAPLAAAQSIVYTTSTTTITELVVCTTTQYATKSLDYCPCTAVFPSVSRCTNCQTCSTTLVSPTTSSGPYPTGDEFTVDLTIGLDTGYERVTLSRVGNTVGIGGTVITFNLSDSGLLRDVLTGDTVYVILPTGTLRKRFEGSVDLLIGPNPPSTASKTTWYRTSQGELKFEIGKSTSSSITLAFGVALDESNQIDTTVPIQMYDVSEGVPSDIETGIAEQSSVTGSVPITRSGEEPSTISVTSSSRTSRSTSSTESSDKTSPSTSSTRTISTRTTIATRYGPTTGISTTTQGSGVVIIIITLLQAIKTATLYGSTATTSTEPFDPYAPTLTVYAVSVQAITTVTFYGSVGYTSTPTIGSVFPTLTAIAELPQVTITNTTYGSQFSTISFQENSLIPTITIYLQFTPTTTITTTSYVWNQFPIVTTTIYGTVPTATELIISNQYREYFTTTATFDSTITIGPDNPTATISFFVNPTTTFTEGQIILHWNFTSGQTSIETPSQTPGYTRTIILHMAYPAASYIRFQPSDANPASPQYFAASTTSLTAAGYSGVTAWYLLTRAATNCTFIYLKDELILATDPDSGTRLPFPGRLWSFWNPVEPTGKSLLMFVLDSVVSVNPSIKSRIMPITTVFANRDLMTVQSGFTNYLITNQSANFYYNAATGASSTLGDSYTLRLLSTEEIVVSTTGRRNSLVGSTMMSMTSSAPTA
ncbi:hypothetical protein TWF703_006176 [Orbilia oligospora]|uniref:Uncharacterized protein n=1 Tax=Orbilia oligospora TaxID=2813651 RepID=A0A7C8NK52_ORBOL|nr:hypothetical protein TWF703_006176 [Orbilia oligospora]